jgi:Serine aminopeptidase, S33
MGLITRIHGAAEGYEEVTLPLVQDEPRDTQGRSAAVLRRRSARPTKRAVIYPHWLRDAFVPADLAAWYTDRGFHFYVADLRVGAPAGPATDRRAEAPAEYFACLDAAVRHVRDADGIETVVLCAHTAGALIAALWCHARRGSLAPDALILISPEFGRTGSWLARRGPASTGPASTGPASTGPAGEMSGPARGPQPLLTGAQRRLRRGLEIGCPVLVMSPSAGWDAPGGAGGLLAARRSLTAGRATVRLGAHVTWLKLDGERPGQAWPDGPDRKRFFDELGRWLGAYLSGQVRDQLL